MDDSIIILRNIATLLSSAWETLNDPYAPLNHTKARQTRRIPAPKQTPLRINLRALAQPQDLALLPQISYQYDPLPTLPRQTPGSPFSNPHKSPNAVALDPIAANLPYRSNMNHVQASKHWNANLTESVHLLQLLAEDYCASDIEVKQGITMTKLAKKALASGIEHGMILAQHYMFAHASEQRMRHIAALTMLYFIFDDKVEETPDDKLRIFRDDFLRRFSGQHDSVDTASTPFRDHITQILDEIDENDSCDGGSGGREMVNTLRGAFKCVRPSDDGFRSIDEYMSFRRTNVGADFVIAAAKYGTHSTLDLTSPQYATFLQHLSNHLSIVNDLASYDKELRALEQGATDDMINLVHVIKTVTGLEETCDAKTVAFALQRQAERGMVEQIEKFRTERIGKGDEEERILDALVLTCTGNAFFCMTTNRYGGEGARI